MALGLKCDPETVQQAIDVLLTKVKWQVAMVYLDDIEIFSQIPNKHIVHDHKILTLLNEADVPLHIKKCELITTRTDYLGHVVWQGTSRCRQG